MFIATPEEIRRGEATDIYFKRTKEVLVKSGRDKRVRMEFHAYSLPRGYEWGVFSGLEEALEILKGKEVNVYAMPEGTLFRPMEPLMVIEGKYSEFAELETALLGIIRHSTSISTKAARIKKAAGNKPVMFFGLRAVHPVLQPMVDRAAYIGGVDAVAGTLSEKRFGIRPVGTMPHALIVTLGNSEEAWSLFDKYVDPSIPRIALVDTFCDERDESLRACKLLGDKLEGVRLDTPSSRRGNFKRIIEEVRWTLKINGCKDVKILVSGGLDEEQILDLRDVVDAFGVGTAIAFPKSVDVSADIVEVFENGKWVPRSKRGKLPGFKQLYVCNDKRLILPWNERSPEGCKPILHKVMEKGELVVELPSLSEIRNYVLEQLKMT